MIIRVEALRYRCLRYVDQAIAPFQILVGPNASGKSAFLDVPMLVGDLLSDGVRVAVQHNRSPDIRDLVWMRQGERFEVAVELTIPQARREKLKNGHETVRYEVEIGHDEKGELCSLLERLWLKPNEKPGSRAKPRQLELFPSPKEAPETILVREDRHAPRGWKKVVTKSAAGNTTFYAETSGWQNPFKLGRDKLALSSLPEDEEKFPVATWAKQILREGVQRLALNSEAMRKPAPPGSPREFQPDGSNLPWVVEALRTSDGAGRFHDWIAHVQTALPDVETVETVEREEDRHRYLRVVYRSGLRAPSWTVSDGTLRFLALTLVSFLDPSSRVFMIEEPENGIHPQAVESLFQALSTSRECQVLCATHSPVVLSLAEPSQLLCFARGEEGATDIVPGNEHPQLGEWKKDVDLGTLFATGVLG